jgi:hypothetical protein
MNRKIVKGGLAFFGAAFVGGLCGGATGNDSVGFAATFGVLGVLWWLDTQREGEEKQKITEAQTRICAEGAQEFDAGGHIDSEPLVVIEPRV